MSNSKAEIEKVDEWVRGDWTIKEFISNRNSQSRFVGIAMVHQEMQTPEGVAARDIPVPFDIIATDINDAFKHFDDGQNQKLKELQSKANIPKIIRARGRNGGGLIE